MEEKKKKEDEDEDSRLQYSSNEGRESLRVNTLANKKTLINPSHFFISPQERRKIVPCGKIAMLRERLQNFTFCFIFELIRT